MQSKRAEPTPSKTAEAKRAYARQWRANNPEKAKELAARTRSKNRDKINARQRAAYTPKKGRENNLKALYGMTTDEYEVMFKAQDGRCAMCARAAKLHVDHNHTTGRVRELLCSQCNTGVGLFQEDVGRLTAAIAYLQKHNKALESK